MPGQNATPQQWSVPMTQGPAQMVSSLYPTYHVPNVLIQVPYAYQYSMNAMAPQYGQMTGVPMQQPIFRMVGHRIIRAVML